MTAPSLRPCALLSTSAILAASLLSPTVGWGFSSARPRLDLVVATSHRPTSPDARTWNIHANRPLLSWIHDTLFELTYLDEIPRLRTVLATERGSWDAKRTTLTIRVKSGTTFSSGEPITARHFIASWETLASLPKDSAPQRAFLSRLRSFEARDTETLILKLHAPDPDFEKVLTLPFTAPIALGSGILPSSIASTDHFSATQKPPASSGPFVLTDWHPGFGLVLRARDGYSNSFYPTEAAAEYRDLGYLQQSSKPLPQVDGIRVDWTESEAAAWKKFSEGNADLLDLDPEFASQVVEPGKPWLLQARWSSKGIKLERGWTPAVTVAVLNLKTLPRVEVRRKILARLNAEYWSSIPGFADHSLPRADLPQLPQLDKWVDVGPTAHVRTAALSGARPDGRTAASRTGQHASKISAVTAPTPLRIELVGQDAQGEKMLESAQQRLESAGFAPESRNSDLVPAVERFRRGEVDVLIIGWNWDAPSWASVLDPILWLQPQDVRGTAEFRAVETAASTVERKPGQKARELNALLEKLAVWSPGPRHHRQSLVQPWVFGFHIHPAVENPQKYLRVDRELRKNYLGY
jgi:ABC-type transport system substrate-binding protein